jgi:hypothetical protein
LPGWQRDERRKQAAEGSLGSPEKRTKDENEDEDEHDRDMALNTYLLHLTLFHPGKPPSPIEAEDDDEDEKDSEMTLSRYKSPGYCHLSLRDADLIDGQPGDKSPYVFSACRRNVGGANKYSLCYLTPLRFDVGRKRRLHDDFHTSCASPESKVA